MSIRNFIKEHRKEIDKCIRTIVPNCGSINDEDRRQWILNDESLYN